ncbi:hypothetical protein D3C87_1242380 [compost metagenome]
MKILNLALPLFLVSSVSLAGVTKGKTVVQKSTNSTCLETDSCTLKEFKVQVNKYTVNLSEGGAPAYGYNASASYKTERVADLEDYAIVQFIKGCRFSSIKKADGTIEKSLGTRTFYGKSQKFLHKQWEIDSIDTDPVYYNNPDGKRHDFYRWIKNQKPVSYMYGTPAVPELSVPDSPGTVSYAADIKMADNYSFEFKTCVYKTKDVPQDLASVNVNFARPVKCLDWEASYIYNFKSKTFDSPSGLDPFCR